MEIINLKNTIEMDFEKIINNKSKCDEYINQIQEIIEKINIKYNSLMNNIKENHNKEIPIYLGIDSLNFQNKLYTYKLLNIKKNYDRIFNRIYADYYKTYKLIRKYILLNTSISAIDINLPLYKDLDQDKYYNFEETIRIQNTISQYIQALNDIITKKNISIQPFINSNNAGYAVNCYITEEKTNITIYTEKCLLFINYLTTFNKYHNNYLLDFLLQCRFIIATIKNDIDFNSDNELLCINKLINSDFCEPNETSETNDINETKVWESIKAAQLEELVYSLPKGIKTNLGENGIRLSGGQRQRIALARAFYRDAKVLVLDEATSSLDNKTEAELINAINILRKKMTIIFIAHRLSTVRDCDCIYEFEMGEIKSYGKYDELIEKSVSFREMIYSKNKTKFFN